MMDTQLSGSAGAALAFLAEVSGKSLLVLLVAAAIVFMYRRQTAADRHRVWFVALSGVILFPVLGLLLPSWEAFTAPSWVQHLNGSGRPVAMSTDDLVEQGELVDAGAVGYETGLPDATSEVETSAGGSPVQRALTQANGDNPTISALSRFGKYVAALHWTTIAFWAWLAGAFLVLGHLTTGAIGVLFIARRSTPIQDQVWLDLCDEIGDRLFITREIRLLQCPGATMPMTWGGINPIVLLPSDASDWSEERRRCVLTHEFAHIKRWDTATQGIAQLACAVYWFNPFIWIAARKLRVEREKACDDQVISAGTVPSSYAQHLLDIASTMKTSHFQPLGAVAMARPSQLEGRVLSILDRKVERQASGIASRLTLSFLFSALILPLAAMSPRASNSASESGGIESVASQAPDETVETETEGPAERIGVPQRNVEETPSPLQRQIVPAQEDTIERRARLIQAFVSALEDDDAQIRKNAVHMLGEMESGASIDALSRALRNDSDPDVRSSAAWSLGQIEDESAVEALTSAIEDVDADVRRMAIWALGQIESVEAVPGLRRALNDASADVRRSVVWALGQIEDPGTLDALVEAARDEDREVRRSAVWAMGQIEEPSAIPALSTALTDEDPEVRSRAAWALGQIEDAGAVDVLIRALEDDNEEVRKNAAWALAQIEDPKAIPGLIRILNTGDVSQKKFVLNSLSDFDMPDAQRAIVGALSDEEEVVRAMAAMSLRDSEGREYVEALKKTLLEDASPRVKQAAAAALTDMDTDDALDALDEALGANNPAVKEAVMRSLRGYPSMSSADTVN